MRISDLMDAIQDDTVPVRERDVAASERIKEVTMAKLHANNLETNKKKRLGKSSAAAIIAAAVVLALAGTALAAGHFWHHVNWDGEEIWEPEPMATVPPDALEEDDPEIRATEEEIGEILSQAGDRELVVARWNDGSCEAASRREDIASPEALEALLAQEDTGIYVPFAIPEDDYEFTGGYVCYQLAEGFQYTLVSTEERDGYTIERYTAPAEGDFIGAYTLTYAAADGNELYVYAQLQGDAETAFGHEDGARVEALTVDGMDNALLLEGTNYAEVFLRQTLAEPIPYTSIFNIMVKDSNGPEDGPEDQYIQAVYELHSTAPDGDALAAMIAP